MKAMQISRDLFSTIGRIIYLMMADPMPISGVASGMAINLAAASTGRSMTEGPEAINILCREVQERIDKGIGVVEKGAPRVLNFAQHFSDPGITHMMEAAGLAVAATIRAPTCFCLSPSVMEKSATLRADKFKSSRAVHGMVVDLGHFF
jgi:hypothetical protein